MTGLLVPAHVEAARSEPSMRELVDWCWPISQSVGAMRTATSREIAAGAHVAFSGMGQRNERMERLIDEARERFAEYERKRGR